MSDWIKAVAIALVVAGCGTEVAEIEDGGSGTAPIQAGDAGGDVDAGHADAGVGEPDAGGSDAGEPDAGQPDAGEPDAGTPDAGEPDAGTPATCSMCHGSPTSPAPPRSLDGGTATTDRGVGAHQSHLSAGSTWHRTVACGDCHVVPATVGEATHIGAQPAEVTFSALAAQGTTASWSGTTCTVYCHGSTLAGGINKQPAWTTVNGTQAACGTCHSLPPSGKHPANTACSGCHGAVMNADNLTFKDPALHINGTVDR